MRAVIVGASAGGPREIQTVLEQLPAEFPAPIAICQHMTDGASAMWAERLNECCSLEVVEAQPGMRFTSGRVYIAPAGRHMRLVGPAHTARISLLPDFADALHIPSIDFLMSSAAEVFGSRTLGVLLTGMGSDGAQGMLSIREAGGATVCQSVESAPFSSMPRSAAALGGVCELADLEDMPELITMRVEGRI